MKTDALLPKSARPLNLPDGMLHKQEFVRIG